MSDRGRQWRRLRVICTNDNFVKAIGTIEGFVSIVLSLAMVVVIFVAVFDLVTFMFQELITAPVARFNTSLFTLFGLFLNVLIALEILENITAYLKKQVIQVELVIATSLIAVARKIIILDLEKTEGINLIALAAAILSLSLSYWFIRRSNREFPPPEH